MDPLSLCNGDAASIEVAADISALLDKVGLKGPKLAASKGDEEGLARQLTAELKLAMEDRSRLRQLFGGGCIWRTFIREVQAAQASKGPWRPQRFSRLVGEEPIDREDATESGESGSAEEGQEEETKR